MIRNHYFTRQYHGREDNKNIGSVNTNGVNKDYINVVDVNCGNIDMGSVNMGNMNSGDVNLGGINMCNANMGGVGQDGVNIGNVSSGNVNVGDVNMGGVNSGNTNVGDIKMSGDNMGDVNVGNTASSDSCEPIVVRNLAIGYGSKVVLKEASFELRAGEVLAIIGPNGAGKSTLLKTLAAQLPILDGSIRLMGADIRTLRPEDIARCLSLFLTDRPSSDWMTCRELVSAGRYPYTGRLGLLSEADWSIVDASMKRMDATELSELPFNGISDGQKQRVLLARALCQEPDVLLLDEPASFLDIRFQLELVSTLRSLAHDDGLAIAVTMHDLGLVRRMADRVLCLRDGHIDRIGTADEILSNHYMEQLFGLPAGSL